jgi:hypothetical protein
MYYPDVRDIGVLIPLPKGLLSQLRRLEQTAAVRNSGVSSTILVAMRVAFGAGIGLTFKYSIVPINHI